MEIDNVMKQESFEKSAEETVNCPEEESTVAINGYEIPVKTYQGERVLTFADIDTVYEQPDGTAKKQFDQKYRCLTENKDFFRTESGQILLTETGYFLMTADCESDAEQNLSIQFLFSYFLCRKVIGRLEGLAPELRVILDQKPLDVIALLTCLEATSNKQVLKQYESSQELFDTELDLTDTDETLSDASRELTIVARHISVSDREINALNRQITMLDRQIGLFNSQLTAINDQLNALDCQLTLTANELEEANRQIGSSNVLEEHLSRKFPIVQIRMEIIGRKSDALGLKMFVIRNKTGAIKQKTGFVQQKKTLIQQQRELFL